MALTAAQLHSAALSLKRAWAGGMKTKLVPDECRPGYEWAYQTLERLARDAARREDTEPIPF